MDELYKHFINYRESLKLFHFQCKKFSEHKSSDETLSEYDNLFDKFIETYIGINGKSISNIKTFNIVVNPQYIDDKTREMINILKEISLDFDLANIRDEIVGTLNKFLYLLQFV